MTTLAALLVAKPSFAQWEAPPSAASAAKKPARFPYSPGEPVPRGYHLEDGVRPGLVVTGAIMTTLAYSLGALTLSGNGCHSDGWMLLPVAGPFIAMSQTPRNVSSGPCEDPEGIIGAVRIQSALGQSIGGGLLLMGALFPRQYLVANQAGARAPDKRVWAVVPALGPSSAGVSMIGRF